MTDKRYEMVYGNVPYQADTLTELVDVLIPGYTDIPEFFPDDIPVKSLEARTMFAEETVMTLRDLYLVAAANETGIDNPGDMTTVEIADAVAGYDPQYAEDLKLMVSTDPGFPVLVGAAWDHPVPVVAVTTSFVDGDDILPPPSGNVVLIDPTNESTLLRTMQDAGLLSFGELPPDQSAAIDDDPGEEII